MTAQEFRMDRHNELWKEKNKQLTRWTLWTAIFASVVLLKVLVPYTEFSQEIAALEADQQRISEDMANTEKELALLGPVDEGLHRIRKTIEQQPWMAEKDQLIQDLKSLSSSREYQRLTDEQKRRRIQAAADDKVRRIVQQVDDRVIGPLAGLLDDPAAKKVLAGMFPLLKEIREDMRKWTNEHIGNRRWYETIQRKDQELRELTASLNRRQQQFLSFVAQQQQKLDRKRKSLSSQQEQNRKRIEANRAHIHELDVKMQGVLPSWVRGLILPQEMLQIYPFVLLVLFGFIGLKAVLARHHYLVVREGQRLESLSVRDPAVSSFWTLVYRGAFGTALTAAVYIVGIIALWLFFEWGSRLVAEWLNGESGLAWAWIKTVLPLMRMLGRVLFAAAIAGILWALFKDYVAFRHSREPV